MTLNLSAYDNLTSNTKSDTWINTYAKRLYSYSLPKYNYYKFLKKWNMDINKYDYYLACSNEKLEGKCMTLDIFGNKRSLKVASFLKDYNQKDLKNSYYLTFELDSKQKDGIVLKINNL